MVIVTTEERGLVEVDALPHSDLVNAWKTANGIMDVFPKRLYNLHIINMTTMALKLQKNLQVVPANLHHPTIIHRNIDETSLFSPVSAVAESINTVHYKPKPDRLLQM